MLAKYEGDDNGICEVWCPYCKENLKIYATISTLVEVKNPLKQITLDCSYCKSYGKVEKNIKFYCEARKNEYSDFPNRRICNLFELKKGVEYTPE